MVRRFEEIFSQRRHADAQKVHEIVSNGENVEKGIPSALLGNVISAATMENRMEILKELKRVVK